MILKWEYDKYFFCIIKQKAPSVKRKALFLNIKTRLFSFIFSSFSLWGFFSTLYLSLFNNWSLFDRSFCLCLFSYSSLFSLLYRFLRTTGTCFLCCCSLSHILIIINEFNKAHFSSISLTHT